MHVTHYSQSWQTSIGFTFAKKSNTAYLREKNPKKVSVYNLDGVGLINCPCSSFQLSTVSTAVLLNKLYDILGNVLLFLDTNSLRSHFTSYMLIYSLL